MNNKILCIGMKRSGSTLQFNMARLLLESQGRVINLGYVQKFDLENRFNIQTANVQSLIAKCHDPDWEFGEKFLCKNKVLYIYRDLRSVYASMKLRTNISVDNFIYEMKEDLVLYSKFENDKRVLVQKYENVYARNREALVNISNYLQVEFSNKSIVKILDLVSINSVKKQKYSLLKQKEIATSVYRWLIDVFPKSSIPLFKKIPFMIELISIIRGLVVHDEQTLMYTDHVSKSKGSPSAWKDILSNDEVSKIEHEFYDWLNAHGYITEL